MAEDFNTKTWLELEIAYSYSNLGDAEEAINRYKRLENRIGEDININSRIASKIFTDLGSAFYDVGEYESAIEYALIAAKNQRENKFYYDLARSNGLLGYLYFKGHSDSESRDLELNSAIKFYNQQIIYAEKVNNFSAVSDSNDYLAQIYIEKMDYENASLYIVRAFEHAGPIQEFKALITEAAFFAAQNNKTRSCEIWEDAKELYEEKSIEAKIGPDTVFRIEKLMCSNISRWLSTQKN